MPKDKLGNKISWKDFFSRWREGVDGITKKQQIKMQIQSNYIVLLGISIGLFFMLFKISTMWWVIIILVGAYFNVTIGIIGLVQQYNVVKKFHNMTFDIEKEVKETCLMK